MTGNAQSLLMGGFGGPGGRIYKGESTSAYEDQVYEEKDITKPNSVPVNKPSKHQNEESKPTYGNQYPNGIGPFTTLVGAAIAPAIIPLEHYPDPSSYPENSKPNKSSTKKHSSHRHRGSNSKKSSKDSEWQSYSSDSYYNSNKINVRKDKPANPVYFDFLNTHTSSQNYPNLPDFKDVFDYEYTRANGQFNERKSHRAHNSGSSKKSKGGDSYKRSQFNGYNPALEFNRYFPAPYNFQ